MSAQGGYQDLLERSASVPYKKVLVVEPPWHGSRSSN